MREYPQEAGAAWDGGHDCGLIPNPLLWLIPSAGKAFTGHKGPSGLGLGLGSVDTACQGDTWPAKVSLYQGPVVCPARPQWALLGPSRFSI